MPRDEIVIVVRNPHSPVGSVRRLKFTGNDTWTAREVADHWLACDDAAEEVTPE